MCVCVRVWECESRRLPEGSLAASGAAATHRWFCHLTWVLGTELGFFLRAVMYSPDHRAIPPGPNHTILLHGSSRF